MNKEEILNVLKKYSFDKNEFIILSGAALVLLGIKDKTNDIDISFSERLYNKILKDFKCILDWNNDGYDIWYLDGIINFGKNYYNKEYILINEYKVQSLKSIYELKLELNREKDKKDIENILKYAKNNNIKL